MRIAIVAGEASGDILGAGLIEALKLRVPDVEVFGVSGPRMDAAGCESLASIDVLSVMGLVEVLKEVPRLIRFRKSLIEQIVQRQPDVVIGIDAPDFNLGLERRLRDRGIKTVHYVSPSVWAWRQGRVKGIARSVNLMLTLFPFEAAFYRDSGIPVRFVGHPLADAIQADPDRVAARERLGMDGGGRVLALLPGSRGSEIDRLAPAFLAAATTLCRRHPDLRCVLPAANPKARARLDELTRGFDLPLTVVDGESQTAMAAADVVMIASGTATLETLLPQSDFLTLHCPATPETTDLMTARTLAMLPDGAVLVNAARGALVDEAALIAALDAGKLAAAGLDCFKTEPGGNPAFSGYDNIFMLPHIGSATKQTRDAMGYRALDNLDAFFAGGEPRDLV